MVYYKVVPQFDGKVTSKGYTLVANELLTSTELNKRGVKLNCVAITEIPKSRVYKSFGVRFEKN